MVTWRKEGRECRERRSKKARERGKNKRVREKEGGDKQPL